MSEQRTDYGVGAQPVKVVRLENFVDPDWQSFLNRRLFARYPAARVVSRQPHVVLVELRMSNAWSPEDDDFFAEMRTEGYFRRWETLSELPPSPTHNRATYKDIGARIGEGERLTLAQQGVLLSQLHDFELRARLAEQEAEEQSTRADAATEHANRMATDWNALLEVLDQELSLKVYADGKSSWIAEDLMTGKILMRGKTLAEIYQTAIRRKHDGR
jgi:hypothetical protein